MTILRIALVAFCFGAGFSDANIEPYNQVRDEQFIKDIVASDLTPEFTRLDELNTTKLDLYSDPLLQPLNLFGRLRLKFDRWVKGPYQQEIYVATEDNKPVGFIRWYFQPSKQGFIHQMAVSVAYRNKGYGKALLQKVIERAQEQTIKEINLNTSDEFKDAQKLYEKMGFIKTDEYQSPWANNKVTIAYKYSLNGSIPVNPFVYLVDYLLGFLSGFQEGFQQSFAKNI